ncbi:MAG: septum formation initiator family protein [Sediminicola sp.]|tara:strand:- start:25344 stop:25676 length:333 start_codon:yes stop_codon:yes gene_type:complete
MGLKELRKKKWFGIVTNTYVLVLTVFLIWMLFFDTNSLLIHWELQREIEKLEKQKEYLHDEIARDKRIIKKLSDKKELEKFGREQYFLKKKDEEIYLIEFEDSLKNKENE